MNYKYNICVYIYIYRHVCIQRWGFHGGSAIKNLPDNAGDARDVGSIPVLERSPWEGNGNPLQYSCLENPMDRGAWWSMVHKAHLCQTRLKQLSTHACKYNDAKKSRPSPPYSLLTPAVYIYCIIICSLSIYLFSLNRCKLHGGRYFVCFSHCYFPSPKKGK